MMQEEVMKLMESQVKMYEISMMQLIINMMAELRKPQQERIIKYILAYLEDEE